MKMKLEFGLIFRAFCNASQSGHTSTFLRNDKIYRLKYYGDRHIIFECICWKINQRYFNNIMLVVFCVAFCICIRCIIIYQHWILYIWYIIYRIWHLRLVVILSLLANFKVWKVLWDLDWSEFIWSLIYSTGEYLFLVEPRSSFHWSFDTSSLQQDNTVGIASSYSMKRFKSFNRIRQQLIFLLRK